MARNRNLSNRTASNRGSTRNLRIVLTSLNYRLDDKNFLSFENKRVKTLYRGNSHSHQRSVPNPMSFSNNWSLQNSFSQKSSQNFSPNTLSPPQVRGFQMYKVDLTQAVQNYHKRASSFDPHLISQRTPPYNSPDSLQNSQLSLQRSNQVSLFLSRFSSFIFIFQHSIQSSATSLGGDSDRIPDLNSLTSQMNLHI